MAERIEMRHPRSFRLADAMFQKALAYEKLGQRLSAKVTLRSLLERYPKEPIRDTARRKLAELSNRTPSRSSAPPLMTP